jgi:hypothetical protein
MSKIVNRKDLDDSQIALLFKEAKVTELRTTHNPFPKPKRLFGVDGEKFWIPIHLPISGQSYREYNNGNKLYSDFDVHIPLLTSETDNSGLDRDQNFVFSEALWELGAYRTCFLHVSTGFGKSMLGTHLIHALGRKAAIFVYSSQLQSDWLINLRKGTNANVYLYKTKEPPMDSHIDIIGLRKGSALSVEFLSRYQTVVIDEVDQIMSDESMKLLLKIAPEYLIGMTATLERTDGLHVAFNKYFGDKSTYITRFIEKPDAVVIKYQTDFVGTEEYDGQGNLIDTVLSDSIACNAERHKCIERLVRNLHDKSILILSNRIHEIQSLYELLKDLDVDYKTDKKKSIDKTRRILIGGYKSFGRGFDRPGLQVVIMLSSFRNVKQYEGRLRSDCGYIYDFVDKNSIFENRWKTRLTWYNKRKMNIKYQVDGTNEVYELPQRVSRKQFTYIDPLSTTTLW